VTTSCLALSSGVQAGNIGLEVADPIIKGARHESTFHGSTAVAVVDRSGNRLDGDWTNSTWTPPSAPVGGDTWPSGDGTAGGDFQFRFNVLPGDADQSGTVNFSDLNTVLTTITDPAIRPRATLMATVW